MTSSTHQHGPGCGHLAVRHDGHLCYLRDGHLEHPEAGKLAEHAVAVTQTNPAQCRPTAVGHEKNHVHGPGCGHAAVPHGDHVDYLVNGHLHHAHGDHCDDHGPLEVIG